MSTTPTGNYALTIHNLETLLCSSAQWQTLCGAATVDAARDFVYWTGAAPVMDGELPRRPLAWIRLKEGAESRMDSAGPGADWHVLPLELLIELADAAPTGSDTERTAAFAKERQVVFLNNIWTIVSQMQALAKTAGYLCVTAMVFTGHAVSTDQELPTEGRFQQARFDVVVG